MIHNGKEVRDAEGKLIGHTYGIVEDAPMNEPEEAPNTPTKKTTKKTASKKQEA